MNKLENMLMSAVDRLFAGSVISESYASIQDDLGNSMKVYLDPSAEFMVNLFLKWHDKAIGGILDGEEICVWDRDLSSHESVAKQLGYHKDFVGFYLYPKVYDSEIDKVVLDVAEYSGMGKLNYNSAKSKLMKSKFMKNLRKSVNIYES